MQATHRIISSTHQKLISPLIFNKKTYSKVASEAQVAGGHKATINSPRTSEEAKQHSREVLDKEFNGGNVPGANNNYDKNPDNVARGLKATVNNPRVSNEAKKNAKERLNQM
ncbi:hypothetical protein RRF57_004267 [Xylaria bambusicola]|uniref:Conidiation-specific protein 6 n=1 Tax=Xylaria bambusicola TaxID=326684 RepID=A0AAN7Z495_9PEZI